MTETVSAGLEVLLFDHHMIAVQKPARMLVASEQSGETTLLSLVRAWNAERQVEGRKGYCVPIHFLDRPVSGVVLFALSSKGAARINEQFRKHTLQKTYWAVTEAAPRQSEGRLIDWIVKDKDTNISRVVNPNDPDAKRCELSYRVLAHGSDRTCLVEVKPITGRSHQIRVQLSHMGCSIVGDTKYGAKNGWGGFIALHAAQVQMSHPVGGTRLDISAPLPSYWKQIWHGEWPDNHKGSI